MKVLSFMFLILASSSVSAQRSPQCDEIFAKLSKMQKQLSDWADLARYREANAKLPPPAKGEDRVVFVGDSITDLWDEAGFGGFFPGRPYVNRGISGQTTPQMLLRFPHDVIALRPKVVVILAGTNDIAGNTGPMTLAETGANIRSMAELARANGIKIVISSVIPVSDNVRNKNGEYYIQTRSRPPAAIIAMNDRLRMFAKDNGHTYLDYYGAMVGANGLVKDGITYDGLHPNADGYAIMAPMAEAAIMKVLAGKK